MSCIYRSPPCLLIPRHQTSLPAGSQAPLIRSGRESCWRALQKGKAQRQRARHENLIFIKLGYVDIKRFAWVFIRRVESDALDRARRLHGKLCLFTVCWAEVIWRRHCISKQKYILIEKLV